MSAPTVVGVLDKLEAKGMVERYRSTRDRRVVHSRLTDLGRADAFFAAQRAVDFDTAMVWAGVAVDLIHDVAPAAQLEARISAEAEQHLRAAAARCGAGP